MPAAELGQERIVDQLDRGRFEALHIVMSASLRTIATPQNFTAGA
jgi:hypothetical protein